MAQATDYQQPYRPHSQGRSVNTETPTNLQQPIDRALSRLEQQIGNLDDYVATRLQYDSPQQLHQYFSAEQVDALALAIHNMENGKALILGDQTGIGKGRVVAGMVRYATLSDKIPVFCTDSAKLYTDLLRDLQDIGVTQFKPLATNRDLRQIELPGGGNLRIPQGAALGREMQKIVETGHLGQYDGIFTTYSQLQTVRGQETQRRNFLRDIAPQSILLLDESHLAGGTPSSERAKSGVSNRADFVRGLQQEAAGVMYSSATYAKNPHSMTLYQKTSMQDALDDADALSSLMHRGGVPLQQTVSGMIAEEGQYIRRERSFQGISFNPEVLPVNHEVAENIADVMQRILKFDQLKNESVKEISKDLKAQAKQLTGDGSIGDAGAKSTNFTSSMHNFVAQMVLGLKAEAVVEKSLELLRQEAPEKPVIALSNTMGSFIGQYASQQDLSPGEAMDANFGDLLRRYLERSRDVIEGDPWGKKTSRRLTDGELGPKAVAAFEAIKERIDEIDFSRIPVSPIDYITNRLEQEGYRVREITGRKDRVEYRADGQAIYRTRSGRETGEAAKVQATRDFNDGIADVMILNRSGATGISLHASEKFQDQQPRHMLLIQPEGDINLVSQMFGRIHRTGQVELPRYSLLMADIPAEKRPGAVLMKKMASLNANTTAARSSGMSLKNVPDLMNDYGNEVVVDVMQMQPRVHAMLNYPLKSTGDSLEPESAVAKVTGRMAALPLKDQERIWNLIEGEYAELVARKEAMGENILEADDLKLDARTIARMELEPATGPSPFQSAVQMQVMDCKVLKKPYSSLEAINIALRNLNQPEVKQFEPEDLPQLFASASATAQALSRTMETDYQRFIQHLQATTEEKVVRQVESIAQVQQPRLKELIETYPIGTPVQLVAPGSGEILRGFVARVWRRGDTTTNPVAASNWRMKFIVADGMRELTLPLSKVNQGGDASYALRLEDDPKTLFALFALKRQTLRENRQILTGNLLKAYERYPQARVVNFTDCRGERHTGLLLKQDQDLTQSVQLEPVTMPSVETAQQILESGISEGRLTTRDGHLSVVKQRDGYKLVTPKAKTFGGRYYLNGAILAAVEGELTSIADRMEASVSSEQLPAVLTAIMKTNGWALRADENQEAVRQTLGLKVPKLMEVNEPFPEPAPAPAQTSAAPPTPPAATNATPDPLAAPQPPEKREKQNAKPLEAEATAKTVTPAPVTEKVTEAVINASTSPEAIASHAQQQGKPEKSAASFLKKAGLSHAVMNNPDFYLKVEQPGFVPLVLERHGKQMMFTHYTKDGAGELYIETEAVFRLNKRGQFKLMETASNAGFGEIRNCDRSFAGLFLSNLHHQGFAEAARAQHNFEEQAEPVIAKQPQAHQASLFETPLPTAQTSSAPETTPSAVVSAMETLQKHLDQVDPAAGNALAELGQPTQSAADAAPRPAPSATLKELRLWFRAARDMNASHCKLDAIRITGLSAKQAMEQGIDVTLSSEIASEMHQAIDAYKPFQQRSRDLAVMASTILQQVGSRDGNGHSVFAGKVYRLTGSGNSLMIEKATADGQYEPLVVKKHTRFTTASAQAEDLDAFKNFQSHLVQRQVKNMQAQR